MQRIVTERHGEIMVGDKSWSASRHEGDITIGLLVQGGYVHLPGGEPVTNRHDLMIIEPEADRDRALTWFDNRNKPTVTDASKPTKRIVQNPDGSYEFDDGSQVREWAELLAYYKKEPPVDVVNWFHKKLKQEEEAKDSEHVAATAAAKFTVGKRQKPMPIDMNETGELVIVE